MEVSDWSSVQAVRKRGTLKKALQKKMLLNPPSRIFAGRVAGSSSIYCSLSWEISPRLGGRTHAYFAQHWLRCSVGLHNEKLIILKHDQTSFSKLCVRTQKSHHDCVVPLKAQLESTVPFLLTVASVGTTAIGRHEPYTDHT